MSSRMRAGRDNRGHMARKKGEKLEVFVPAGPNYRFSDGLRRIQSRLRSGAVAELALENLAGRTLGQFRDDLDAARIFVGGQPFLAE